MSTPILAIVGFSNSGKTTLMEKLIAGLTAKGLQIASIKHSHHQPEMDTKGKDSWRHKQAGAVGSLLVGPEKILMVKDVQTVLRPQQMANAYFPNADLVLVEGYASMPCPKIEVLRENRCQTLRCDVSELLAVATDMHDLNLSMPQLDLNDTAQIVDFILAWMSEEKSNG